MQPGDLKVINTTFETQDKYKSNKLEYQQIDMNLNAISISDNIAFITAPYEMFCANGMWVKENSPYDVTFVLTSANGDYAYIASELAYTYPCYEVESRMFPKGMAEDLASNMVEMRKEMQ